MPPTKFAEMRQSKKEVMWVEKGDAKQGGHAARNWRCVGVIRSIPYTEGRAQKDGACRLQKMLTCFMA